jgi:hypothetical protein
MQAIVVAALVAAKKASCEGSLSKPIDLPDLKRIAGCHEVGLNPMTCQQEVIPPVVYGGVPVSARQEADEQPLEFQWSKRRRRIRAAAKAYSEQTDADY